MRVIVTGKRVHYERLDVHGLKYTCYTGASGVLGTAVYNAFKASPQNEVLGLAHSRPRDELKVLDLLDKDQVQKVFAEFKPDCELRRSLRVKLGRTKRRARGYPLRCGEKA